MRRFFGAQAQPARSDEERRKRAGVAIAASMGKLPAAKELPPPMPHPSLARQLTELSAAAVDQAEAEDGAAIEEPAAEPVITLPRREPDRPRVTITIAGLPRSGRSVLAHLFRYALAREGIAFDGPDELPSLNWRGALGNLIWRGLKVEFVEAELEPEDADGQSP